MQLLNRRPTRQRAGVLSWSAELAGLETVTQQPERRPLLVRQGELLAIDLPQPVEPGEIIVTVLVEDASGRSALEQVIRIAVPAEEESP